MPRKTSAATRKALPTPRASIEWRAIRAEMEHERYMMLRKMRHEGRIPEDLSDTAMRRQAYEYAVESCRDAVARWNANYG